MQIGRPPASVVPLNRALSVKQSFSMAAILKDRKCVTCSSGTSKLWYNALTSGHAVQYECQSCYHKRYPYHGPCSRCNSEKSTVWLHAVSHDKSSPYVCRTCSDAEKARQKLAELAAAGSDDDSETCVLCGKPRSKALVGAYYVKGYDKKSGKICRPCHEQALAAAQRAAALAAGQSEPTCFECQKALGKRSAYSEKGNKKSAKICRACYQRRLYAGKKGDPPPDISNKRQKTK